MPGLNIQNSRIQQKYSTISGQTPTIAPSLDHTDGSWSPTDIYIGELFFNVLDDNAWFRSLNGIIPLTSGATYISTYLNITGGTMLGALYGTIISANTISGATIYSPNFNGTFIGDGSGLTGLTSTIFTGGTITGNVTFTNNVDMCSASLSASTIVGCGNQLDIFSDVNTIGSLSATTLYGDGSNLTNLPYLSGLTLDQVLTLGDTSLNNNLSLTNGDIILTNGTFFGDGSGLSGITPSINTLDQVLQAGNVSVNGDILLTNGDIILANGTFYGDGSGLTGITTTDNYVTGGTFSAQTLTLDRQNGSVIITGFTDTIFSGGSGSCITDLYVSNIYGCSPITIHDNILDPTSTVGSGTSLIAWGQVNTAINTSDVAFGDNTTADGGGSLSMGVSTNSSGAYSHAQGDTTMSSGGGSHSEGNLTVSSGNYSHAEGFTTQSVGDYSHSEGYLTVVSGSFGHSEGQNTQAIGQGSHAEGYLTQSSGDLSHSEGELTESSAPSSHAEGQLTISNGHYSHAEGYLAVTNNYYSHAEGQLTITSGIASHSEGILTQSIGDSSHAEGNTTQSIGNYSHSEGNQTITIGDSSHAEGYLTQTNGDFSHAEGYQTTANGIASHTNGIGTISDADYQHVSGMYNETGMTTNGAFIVGNGVDDLNRSNLIHAGGNEVNIYGKVIVDEFQMMTGATTGYVLTSDSLGNGTWQSIPNQTFTGGTVNGATNFTNGISATTMVLTTTTGVNEINANTTTDAFRITQLGTGNTFVVQDSTNPDSSPFVIDNSGNVAIGKTSVTSGTLMDLEVGGKTIGINIGNPNTSFMAGTGIFSYGTGIGINGVGRNDFGTVIGIKGESIYDNSADPSTTYYGGEFIASGQGGRDYAVRLSDGTEGIGKFLYSVDANGSANWTSDLSGTSATINGTLKATTISATTYQNITRKGSFGITIDGGGSAITTGVKGYITIPYNGTITGWDILGDQSGSIVVDVWKDTYANFPPTVADTIAGTEKPTLSSQQKNQDLSLSSWTTSVSEGDIIAFNVDSATSVTRVNLTINVTKTS